MTDLLSRLLEFKWKDIAFPIESMEVELGHKLPGHEAWMRNGVDHEDTGRDSLRFTAEIPFYNTIFPGESESWSILYPNQYRLFLNAAAIGGEGTLQHPELGPIQCKLKSCKTKYDGNKRGGCMVSAEWVETIDLSAEQNLTIGDTSPVAEVRLAAASLDIQYPNVRDLVPKMPKHITSLIDVMNAFSAIGDQVQLFAGRQAGMLDTLDYAGKRLLRSMTLLDDVEKIGQKRVAIQMRQGVYDLKRDLKNKGGKVVTYRVPGRTTLAGLAQSLQVDMGAIVELNPRIVAKPVVYENTVVRYRKAA
mgnify:FL=1